jgi:hypothetical protein
MLTGGGRNKLINGCTVFLLGLDDSCDRRREVFPTAPQQSFKTAAKSAYFSRSRMKRTAARWMSCDNVVDVIERELVHSDDSCLGAKRRRHDGVRLLAKGGGEI